ncbi:EamA family transporter [Ferrovibrio sp.]|uniref:DMT family transporter n=1 Tax=Ferrovibrio sp. TaxID=1917215 RepID=UPI0025C05848|nr:EamA family transporter [Ferrovibrio sp.]MBX3456624.1 EamA family transporter [Ferrovibrio sp.]
MTTPARPMNALEWGMLLTLSLLWSGSFFFVAIAIREVPVFSLVTARLLGGALILCSWLAWRGIRWPREWAAWRAFFVMGLLNNAIPFGLIGWSQNHIPSGLASILNATTPLWTVLFAHFVAADERLTPAKLLGLLAGILGVMVLIGPQAFAFKDGGNLTDWLAPCAVLLATCSYAVGALYGRRFNRMGIQPMLPAALQGLMASSLMLPAALLLEHPWTLPMPSPQALASLAGLGLFSSALGYALYFRILASAGATNINLVTFLIPPTAILLGIGFLGESLAPQHIAGMALIGLGLAAIDGRLLRYFKVAR